MIGMLRRIGLSSNAMYVMGFGSIGLSVASWFVSRQSLRPTEDLARADRWGIFVGQWAPTFFALGAAMRLEEQWGEHRPHETMERVKEKVQDKVPVVG